MSVNCWRGFPARKSLCTNFQDLLRHVSLFFPLFGGINARFHKIIAMGAVQSGPGIKSIFTSFGGVSLIFYNYTYLIQT
jgi:hypothetical protein